MTDHPYSPPNPYDWSTSPVQLPGRSRKTGMWITPWVEYGRPVIMDTRQLMTAHDARRRIVFALPLDDQLLRRYQGGDQFPPDALLVLIHPKTYMDLRLRRDLMLMTGPQAAAGFIDGACKLTPGLADRMDWAVIGDPLDDDDE